MTSSCSGIEMSRSGCDDDKIAGYMVLDEYVTE